MTTFSASMAAYEAWLKRSLGVYFVQADLDAKHDRMRESAFVFLRATCWRWAEQSDAMLAHLAGAPRVLAVGDAHIENFGIWRDAEGRLVWGFNDFDEAAPTPYAYDLVRLAASALLALDGGRAEAAAVTGAILEGYRRGLDVPRPFVLERDHLALRKLVNASPRQRKDYWAKREREIAAAPARGAGIPGTVKDVLRRRLPVGATDVRFALRRAGAGGLGRMRVFALGALQGGPVAREAKTLVPSCWRSRGRAAPPLGRDVLALAHSRHRAADHWLEVVDSFLIRRLGPNSRKLNLKGDRHDLSPDLLGPMGHEIANLHAAIPGRVAAIRDDLHRRKGAWLAQAAVRLAQATETEWRDYLRATQT